MNIIPIHKNKIHDVKSILEEQYSGA
uniref:Uncharacterized protein n=1 Tax=Rhizophora mucronata TaxID=61149 RepID=A0A2P2NTT3_RHIMU